MKILVICTGNSARSQMAEGLIRSLGGKRMDVASAGVSPKGLNPLAVRVMAEIGIDISSHRSKDVSEFVDQKFDRVITVCNNAKETCPVFQGARTIHWDVPDPNDLESFRSARDLLKDHIKEFLSSTETAERKRII